MRLFFKIYLFIIGFSAFVAAQESAPADTTMQRGRKNQSTLEGPVSYEARIFDNFIEEKRSVLLGDAKVSYLQISLKAARITVDWQNDLMIAEAMPDTVVSIDGESGDTVKVVVMAGFPEFSEGREVMRGEKMIYNFRTKKGRVLRGRTAFDDGNYSGQVMKMIGKKTAFISDACFTTCDNEEHPHFHFRSQKMRMDINKSVVAKPIVMFIGNIPVLALPFAYFPIEKEKRRSGLILPRYGTSSTEGQYLRGLGYYWAASEYWDMKGRIDYFSNSGIMLRGDLRYNVRYKMRGSLSGSWTRKNFDLSGLKQRRWDLTVRHNHTLSPTMRLAVDATFISSKNLYRQLSANRQMRMQNEIRSNATFTKKLGGSRSITINLNQTRDLETDETTDVLPRISFRGGQTALFKRPESDLRSGPAPSRWYHNIYFSYSSKLESRNSKILNTQDSTFTNENEAGWDHSMRLSSPQKLFGWLTVNPNVSMQETWLTEQVRHYWDTDSLRLASYTESEFSARHTYDFSVSMSTKIYGLFRPSFLPNFQMRHVMTPSISYGYQPDFSDESWQYYDTVQDTSGKITLYDRFDSRLFSKTPQYGRKSLNFSVTNLFQAKLQDGEEEKKFQLFNWNINTSYNWKKPEKKLANFSSSLRADPAKNLSVNMRAIHSPYLLDAEGQELDETYVGQIDWSDKKSIFSSQYLRMVFFSADLSIRFKGTAGGGKKQQSGKDSSEVIDRSDERSLGTVPGDRFDMDDRTGSFSIPWDFSASLSYSDSRYNPNNRSQKFWIKTDLNFNLTRNWRISYRAHFDIMQNEFVSQDFVFERDLHCWEARIAWTPTGLYKRFYFKINIKSNMLKDIKFEKGAGRRGMLGGSLGSYL
ncbi:LPS-assembly protein LptD [bacterium]|nr:LPS-assembly protein LptD [bacterium]